MIISIILTLTVVIAVANIINIIESRRKPKEISMKVELPGNLPIIALSNNNNVYNFLLDSGSNISHICPEYFDEINATILGVYEEGKVDGYGATHTGITMCEADFIDILGNKYTMNLSISEQLSVVSKNIEEETGVKIHGLLGTDFLRQNNYTIDFKNLVAYPKK